MAMGPARRSPGLRAIVAYKLVKAPIMLALAIWLTFGSRTALGSVEWIARQLAEGGAVWSRLADWMTDHVTRTGIRELAVVAWADAFATAIEVALLLTGKPWGEWIVLLGLAAMIPLEIVSLDRHPGWVKVIILILNVAIVLVLARRRVTAMRAGRPMITLALLVIAIGAGSCRGSPSAPDPSLRLSSAPESFAGRAAHVLDDARQKQLAVFIEEARRATDVPGAAIGVIQGRRLVYAHGFGVKDRGAPAAADRRDDVDADTLFMIGSNTKGLTTLLMARLVDRGLVSWTTPATRLWPSFALGDAALTRQLTLQDMVCNCTGMPGQDLPTFFEYAGVTPEDRVAAMKTLMPTAKVGEKFVYSNIMGAAGGFLAAQAFAPNKPLGPAYDDAMQAEVFGPLGMNASTLDFGKAVSANHAEPHARALAMSYQRTPVAREGGVLGVRPAGGIWSNVRDMSRYLLLEIGRGVMPEGKRVVSEGSLLHRRDPQVKLGDRGHYGLGLLVTSEYGLEVEQFGGRNLGYSSDMYFLPKQGLGVVVLTNAGGSNAFLRAVRRRLYELVFDGRPEASQVLAEMVGEERREREKNAALIRADVDRNWLMPLLGEYQSPALGHVSLRLVGSQPTLDVGEWQTPVAQKGEPDGSSRLVPTAPGLAGFFELIPGTRDGKPILTAQMGEERHTLVPIGR